MRAHSGLQAFDKARENRKDVSPLPGAVADSWFLVHKIRYESSTGRPAIQTPEGLSLGLMARGGSHSTDTGFDNRIKIVID